MGLHVRGGGCLRAGNRYIHVSWRLTAVGSVFTGLFCSFSFQSHFCCFWFFSFLRFFSLLYLVPKISSSSSSPRSDASLPLIFFCTMLLSRLDHIYTRSFHPPIACFLFEYGEWCCCEQTHHDDTIQIHYRSDVFFILEDIVSIMHKTTTPFAPLRTQRWIWSQRQRIDRIPPCIRPHTVLSQNRGERL